jgi:RNA polymerase sigma-70 factor (ECF subfamily)
MGDARSQAYRVLLAQSGDRAALEELLLDIQEPLHGYLGCLCGDRHLAEDVLQDVLVLVCRKLIWLREPEVFRPWVYRIASREAFRRLKKERRRECSIEEFAALEIPERPESPVELPYDRVDRLRGLLGTVPHASRVVLMLHYLEGLGLEEIAAVLDIPSGTVKSRLAYGLSVLRQKMGSEVKPQKRKRTIS